jgi:hypothetical protein
MGDKDYELCAVLVESSCRELFTGITNAEELLRIAFKEAHNHFMYTDPETQFKGGVGAVLLTLKGGPEFDRVNEAIRHMGKLSALLHALQQGVPVDMDAMLKEQQEQGIDPSRMLPLRKLWQEAQGKPT